MIPFWEKEPRPTPDGRWVRVYGFANNEVEEVVLPDGDFAELERQSGLR